MSGNEEILRVEQVVKRYGRHTVLEIERLVLHQGDRVVLVGANGSGKTTLLKLLAGVAPPDRGRVWWAPELKRQGLGYVPQAGGLYGELSVLDNLHLRRFLHGMRRADRSLARLARALGLLPLMDKRVMELSGGYQRLTAIAGALQIEPRWLLLDEPFNGIDADHLDGLLAEMAEVEPRLRLLVIAESGTPVYEDATRVVTLKKGRVKCVEP